MRALVLAGLALLCGCGSTPKFVEGTSLSLGAYIPWDGGLYGLELMQYVNGAVVKVSTNTCYQIRREHSSTNSWLWGMMETRESSKTTVDLR